MAEMRVATYKNFIHGPECKCSYDAEVRLRKNPPTKEQLAEAAKSAQAILDERRALDEAQAAREREVLQAGGELQNFINTAHQVKPFVAEDTEAKRLRVKAAAEKKFLGLGLK